MAKPDEEYTFHPGRKFRFDFAWIPQRVAVEIEGGLYHKGRHTTVSGFNADCVKYNLAVLDGWRVLRFTEKMLKNDPQDCIAAVRAILGKEGRG